MDNTDTGNEEYGGNMEISFGRWVFFLIVSYTKNMHKGYIKDNFKWIQKKVFKTL